MFSAFIIVLGMSGDPIAGARSIQTFDTIEACEAWKDKHKAGVEAEARANGYDFIEIKSKCDTAEEGKTAADVFGVQIPETPPE